jgi:hypothetical protein
MDSKSADDITTAIANVASLKLHLAALENVLRDRDPALLNAWKLEISNLSSEISQQFLPLQLESLKKRLEEA